MYDQRRRTPATLIEFRGLFLALRTSKLLCLAAIGRITRAWPPPAQTEHASAVFSLSSQPAPNDDQGRRP